MDNQFGNDFNNQNGFNPNNQFDPNMNQYPGSQANQFGQQPMMNSGMNQQMNGQVPMDQGMMQQPMFDQQPMYEQQPMFDQQATYQQPMYDQQPVQQPMMDQGMMQQPMMDQGMMQQPMQQPVPQPMYEQQPMYDQQPMQVDQNRGMVNNQNMFRVNSHGKGIVGIVLAIVLVLVLGVFVLEYSGTTNLTGMFSKKENTDTKKEEAIKAVDVDTKKETKDSAYEDKVENLCTKIDTSGNYNSEAAADIKEKMNSGSYSDPDLIWELFRGKEYCVNNSCAIYQDNDKHSVHFYNCNMQEYNTGTFEDIFGETLASSMCYYIDKEGNYVNEQGKEYCANHICSITYGGKIYKKACASK